MGLFGNAFTGWHLIVILAVILLIFGSTRLPGLAKGLGQSMRIFKSEVKSMKDDDTKDSETARARADADVRSDETRSTAESTTQPKS